MDTTDDDLAYDGSNEPPKRDLTARERDILCRILESLYLPYLPHNQDEPFAAKQRATFAKYTRLDNDVQTIYNIAQVINPRLDR